MSDERGTDEFGLHSAMLVLLASAVSRVFIECAFFAFGAFFRKVMGEVRGLSLSAEKLTTALFALTRRAVQDSVLTDETVLKYGEILGTFFVEAGASDSQAANRLMKRCVPAAQRKRTFSPAKRVASIRGHASAFRFLQTRRRSADFFAGDFFGPAAGSSVCGEDVGFCLLRRKQRQ